MWEPGAATKQSYLTGNFQLLTKTAPGPQQLQRLQVQFVTIEAYCQPAQASKLLRNNKGGFRSFAVTSVGGYKL